MPNPSSFHRKYNLLCYVWAKSDSLLFLFIGLHRLILCVAISLLMTSNALCDTPSSVLIPQVFLTCKPAHLCCLVWLLCWLLQICDSLLCSNSSLTCISNEVVLFWASLYCHVPHRDFFVAGCLTWISKSLQAFPASHFYTGVLVQEKSAEGNSSFSLFPDCPV